MDPWAHRRSHIAICETLFNGSVKVWQSLAQLHHSAFFGSAQVILASTSANLPGLYINEWILCARESRPSPTYLAFWHQRPATRSTNIHIRPAFLSWPWTLLFQSLIVRFLRHEVLIRFRGDSCIPVTIDRCRRL